VLFKDLNWILVLIFSKNNSQLRSRLHSDLFSWLYHFRQFSYYFSRKFLHLVGSATNLKIIISREIWPNDSFGAADIETEDEFMCLHDIFKMTDLVPQGKIVTTISVVIVYRSIWIFSWNKIDEMMTKCFRWIF
jgi:hypothetical protein